MRPQRPWRLQGLLAFATALHRNQRDTAQGRVREAQNDGKKGTSDSRASGKLQPQTSSGKKLAVWSMIIWLLNACMNMGVSKLRTVLRLACIESFLQDILGEILGDAPEWAFHIDQMEPRFW